jgi:hypothetical protein
LALCRRALIAIKNKALCDLLDVADLVERGLAELLFKLGIHRGQGGHELGLVHVVDHGHALGAQVGHALGIVFVHTGAVGLGAFLGGIEESLLVGGAELVKSRLVHHEDAGRIHMAREREVLLHLVELGRDDDGQRVLLAVHGALLQGGEHLGEGHGRGDDAKALVGGDVHGVLHGAHLQALEVAGLLHVALAVGHVAKAVFGPGQRLETLAVELGQHLLADGAVEHGARMGLVAEQEGNVENFGLGHKVGDGAGGAEGQLLRAQLHGFNRLALATQCAVVEGLHLVAAARALFDFLGKGVDGHALVRVLRRRDADAHGGLRGGAGHEADGKAEADDESGQLHGVS